MIEISAQPKLKVSNFHLGIAFIQNQSPMKTGVTMNQKAKIQFEKSGSLWNLATVYTVRTYTHLEDQVEVATR